MNLSFTIIGFVFTFLGGIGGVIIIIEFICKQNIEFHKILKSFPLISDDIFNNGVKHINNNGTTPSIHFSNDFKKYVDYKESELDTFLSNLEHFDTNKLKFKKKIIISFIDNIKRVLTTKSSTIFANNITGDLTDAKCIRWTALNYYRAYNVINNNRRKKLYINRFTNLFNF